MLPRKMCGGGSSFASAQPIAQRISHAPAKHPIEAMPHSSVGSPRPTAASHLILGAAALGAGPPSKRVMLITAGRLVFQLRPQTLVLGDCRLEQCPVDGIATRLAVDVAHFL